MKQSNDTVVIGNCDMINSSLYKTEENKTHMILIHSLDKEHISLINSSTIIVIFVYFFNILTCKVLYANHSDTPFEFM